MSFISKDEKFELHSAGIIIKKLITTNGYFRNTETGENCGSYVELKKHYFDADGNELAMPLIDKNCYEVINHEN